MQFLLPCRIAVQKAGISKATLLIFSNNNSPTKKEKPKPINNSPRFSTLHKVPLIMPTSPSKVSLNFFLTPTSQFSLSLSSHSQIHKPVSTLYQTISVTFMRTTMLILSLLHLLISALIPSTSGNTCRSYCGNITIDYPFAIHPGCGHPGFRDLLYCINDVLMFHISSGSYRVLEIDYAYQALTLHDPHMSTCDTIVLGAKGNGFAVEQWRAPYMTPSADNVFMLIGCSAQSPLFQGFPGKHLPCRNVSGMSCEEYYGCPAWDLLGHRMVGSKFGSGPPECCAVPFEAIKSVNLSKLQCEGYSSAFSLAPLRLDGATEWSYGIRVKYSVQENDEFCRACEATRGTCGYDTDGVKQLCMCGSSNSTSNCDSVKSSSGRSYSKAETVTGLLMLLLAWIAKK